MRPEKDEVEAKMFCATEAKTYYEAEATVSDVLCNI